MKKALVFTLAAVLPLTLSSVASAATPYTVKPTDSLYKISRSTGVAMSEIAQFNNISNPNLLIDGQVLQIPNKADLKRLQIVYTAKKLLGTTPYVWGGDAPYSGLDCSGVL